MKHINPGAALRRGLIAAATITALAVPAAAGVAAPASAATHTPAVPEVVLISAPPARVTLGHTFQVGVWYQQFSGGRRAYMISVYAPGGATVLHRTGLASPAHWTLWTIRASRLGYYKTAYHCWVNGVWKRTVFYTHSVR